MFRTKPFERASVPLLAYCRCCESRDHLFTQKSINQHNRQVACLNRPWHAVSYPGTLLLSRNAGCLPHESVNVIELIATLKTHMSLHSLASLLGPNTECCSEGASPIALGSLQRLRLPSQPQQIIFFFFKACLTSFIYKYPATSLHLINTQHFVHSDEYIRRTGSGQEKQRSLAATSN